MVIGDERSVQPAQAALQDSRGNAVARIFGHFPTIREVEEYLIAEAMRMAKGNQGIAANLLGIARQTLNKRLK